MAALKGRHALVTGGSRGIGRAIAAALAGAGANVTIIGRNEAALSAAVARGDAHGIIAADVTDVTVNAVCPGYTDTDLVRESAQRIAAKTGRSPDDALAAMASNNPLGRLIEPAEVASAVLFLCAPDASAITGTTLTVAGGEL